MSGRVAESVDDRWQEDSERHCSDSPSRKASAAKPNDSLKNSQEKHDHEGVRLGLPQRLENEFSFELFGTASAIAPEGLEKPGSLSVGEEGYVFRVLVDMRQ